MKFCDIGYNQYFTVDGFVYRKVKPLYNINAIGINREVWLLCTFEDNRIVKPCDSNGKETGVPFYKIKHGEYFSDTGIYVYMRCDGGVLSFGTKNEPYDSPVICELDAFCETYFVLNKPSWVKLRD